MPPVAESIKNPEARRALFSDRVERSKRVRHGKMSTGGGVIKRPGRGAAPTPRGVVMAAVTVRKDERIIRQKGCRGPNDMYGPHTTNDAIMGTVKGGIGMIRVKPGGSFRQGIPNDVLAEAVASCNGLPKSTNLKCPVLFQTISNPADPLGQTSATAMITGVGSCDNTGTQPINLGDLVLFDPNPAMVADASAPGGKKSMFIPPDGIPPEKLDFQTRPWNSTNAYSALQMRKTDIFAKFTDGAWRQQLRACRSDDDLVKFIQTTVTDVCTNAKDIADDMPIRGYLLVWTAWRLMQQFKIKDWMRSSVEVGTGKALVSPDEDERFALRSLSLHTMAQILKKEEDEWSDVTRQYAATLLHASDTVTTPTSTKARAYHSVYCTELQSALTDEALSIEQLVEQMDTAEGILNMAALERLELKNYDQLGYMQRFSAGLALSSAMPGKPFDIIMGKHQ